MKKPMRFLVCASTAALILGAAPIGVFIAPAQAQVAASVTAGVAPPLLPVYAQPPIPGPGYLWIPGYWAWNGLEYYWVPGYWAMPPAVNLFWTPPYWGWIDGVYTFYAGYWAPTVGFYGDIDYGFGYTGEGYEGGFWRNNAFVYNRAVNNLGGAHIANVYDKAVPASASHVSFNGGDGGTTVKPTQAQIAARAHAAPPTAEQARHQEMASRDPALRFNANHGRPPIVAMQRANEFHGAGAEAPTRAAAERPQATTHAPPTRPQVAERAPAAQPRVAEHVPATRQHFAYHAPVRHALAARQHFAYHAPVRHAPAARQHFAYHAPAMQMGAMRPTGGMHPMHFAGAPHFGGIRMGGMHPGAPHIGGGPHMGGGGARHVP
jgi:WXXGXW repeat (2 copies)